MVWAADYARALERVRALEAVLQRIVHTTPHGERWERSYRALQDDARRALER